MSEPTLAIYSRRLVEDDRSSLFDGRLPVGLDEEPVLRTTGSSIKISVLDALMREATRRRDAGDWADDRATVDRWLAPRVHASLRLDRATAADRAVWEWLAIRYHQHTQWRWGNPDTGAVADDRWYGPVHKQVMARLWWGAELFRNGGDYRPVERAFIRQDLINSYLHRPLVRCRSLALGILDVVVPAKDPTEKSAADVNALAGVLNLATAGAPPELETELQHDDWEGYAAWTADDVEMPDDWDVLPSGPATEDTTDDSLRGGLRVAERGWGFTTRGG